MTTEVVGKGPRKVTLSYDEEGYRTYKATWLVKGDASADGPYNAKELTGGLPRAGDTWNFGSGEEDQWATCQQSAEVRAAPNQQDEPVKLWEIDFTYSSKGGKRCQDDKIEDPILTPATVSGSNVNYQEEQAYDRLGYAITTSSLEQIRGPQVEFDKNRPSVKFQLNVPDFETVALFLSMQDTVNQYPIWNFGPRQVKLSKCPWERKFWGQCSIYFSISPEFDIRPDTFDRDLLDEGTKVLHGQWAPTTGHWQLLPVGGMAPDANNASHFDRFKDKRGENCKVILDGFGRPSGVCVDEFQPPARTPIACRLATTIGLDADNPAVYDNGAAGVGAKLLFSVPGHLTIDGVVTALNDVILVKNEPLGGGLGIRNGIYKVTQVGAEPATLEEWTRHTGNDEPAEFVGAIATVSAGTTQTGTTWSCENNNPNRPPIVGTDEITWVEGLTVGGLPNLPTFSLGVRLATAAALPAYTYSSVNNTITFTAAGAQTVDSLAANQGDYIFVKDETAGNAPYNGIYRQTVLGTGSLPAVWTRAPEYVTPLQVLTTKILIMQGTANANTTWITALTTFPTIGTTALTYTEVDSCVPSTEGKIHVEFYQESDFLLLGLPLNFNFP